MPLKGWDSIALGLRHLLALLIGQCQNARQSVINSSCEMLSSGVGSTMVEMGDSRQCPLSQTQGIIIAYSTPYHHHYDV